MAGEASTEIYTSQNDQNGSQSPWRYSWTNDADRSFNYNYLLELTSRSGIAQNQRPEATIAIFPNPGSAIDSSWSPSR